MNQCFSVSSFHLCAGLLDTLDWFETSQWRQWAEKLEQRRQLQCTKSTEVLFFSPRVTSETDIINQALLAQHQIKGTLSFKAVKAAIRWSAQLFPRNILLMTINNAIKTELNKRMLTKIFSLNMGTISFNISVIELLKITLYIYFV